MLMSCVFQHGTSASISIITACMLTIYIHIYIYNCVMSLFFRYLLYAKSAPNPEDGLVYVRSACRAEMKKNVSYFVDVSLSPDGFIKATQCECAAGIGPDCHCKHVCAVLCGLQEFTGSGSMKREVSCTSQLQGFKKPSRVHAGSPVKACKLGLTTRNTSAEGRFVFDTRPIRYRQSPTYNTLVSNLAINYMFTPKMRLLQRYSPANLNAIDLDHDYMPLRASDKSLIASRVTQISMEEAICIE